MSIDISSSSGAAPDAELQNYYDSPPELPALQYIANQDCEGQLAPPELLLPFPSDMPPLSLDAIPGYIEVALCADDNRSVIEELTHDLWSDSNLQLDDIEGYRDGQFMLFALGGGDGGQSEAVLIPVLDRGGIHLQVFKSEDDDDGML
jgi:hypothetical protein